MKLYLFNLYFDGFPCADYSFDFSSLGLNPTEKSRFPLFAHSFIECVLRPYCMPGTILKAVTKTVSLLLALCLSSLSFLLYFQIWSYSEVPEGHEFGGDTSIQPRIHIFQNFIYHSGTIP